ncbi:MAG TPA: RpiB/LacA/LacB family sugar-phosphate isomerase [Pirellulales bacterium]|jgi:ribose 5-phosphate isomerase RpiB|nr:RpiB/LacA/LacB family sugar-phosphate isomerase [Pirellulales bacterium]
MPHSEDQVERIVHAVIQRLGGAGTAISSSGELTLTEKVISAESLANRLNGVQRVIVSARAVVTPAARDSLKEKNITLVRSLQAAAAKPSQLIVASSVSKKGAAFDCADVLGQLRQRGMEVEELPAVGVAQAAANIAAAVESGKKLGVLLTDQAAAALCIANRQRGVRAAMVTNRGELNDLVQNLGVNLLVIDALRRSKSEIQRLVEAFAASPAQACPAQWKQWLD